MKSFTILDEMVADEQIQIMKAALPYVPPSGQRMLSVFAKFMELQKTMEMFSRRPGDMNICSAEPVSHDPLEMLQDIRRYCSEGTQGKIDQLTNTFVMLQLLEMSKEGDT